jgi:TRAP-type C4-dicarboxylate transport system permease small subunit
MDGTATGWFGRLNGRVTRWLAGIAALLLALIAVMTFCDVGARYFLNAPFTFTVEVTELAMGLIVYLGVGLTTHTGGHIVVDVVTLRLSERWRALLALTTNALALGFLAILVWRLWLRAELLLIKGDTTPVWAIPLWPVAFVMALGSVFFLTGVLLHLMDAYGRLADRAGPPAAPPVARPYSE